MTLPIKMITMSLSPTRIKGLLNGGLFAGDVGSLAIGSDRRIASSA